MVAKKDCLDYGRCYDDQEPECEGCKHYRVTCTNCDGTGEGTHTRPSGEIISFKCPECKGSGDVVR